MIIKIICKFCYMSAIWELNKHINTQNKNKDQKNLKKKIKINQPNGSKKEK